MIGQHGITASRSSGSPTRYDAVRQCLSHLAAHTTRLTATVHMPRIDTGLAGGRWDHIEPLITSELTNRGVFVTIYDLP